MTITFDGTIAPPKTRIVYRSEDFDFDGICSAAIVFRALQCERAELIPYTYGDEFDFSDLTADDTVVMLDVSLPMDQMFALNDTCELIWIDHHTTAIEAYEQQLQQRVDGSASEIRGERRVGTATCTLTWWYFMSSLQLPAAVAYFAAYDMGDHSDPNTLSFQYGARTCPSLYGPASKEWDALIWSGIAEATETVNDLIRRGSHRLRCAVTSDS